MFCLHNIIMHILMNLRKYTQICVFSSNICINYIYSVHYAISSKHVLRRYPEYKFWFLFHSFRSTSQRSDSLLPCTGTLSLILLYYLVSLALRLQPPIMHTKALITHDSTWLIRYLSKRFDLNLGANLFDRVNSY